LISEHRRPWQLQQYTEPPIPNNGGGGAGGVQGNIEQRYQAHADDDYPRSKVEAGRVSMRAGHGRSNDEVEAAFAAKRNQVKTA